MEKESQHLQKLIRYYKQETGKTEIDMHEVAHWAMKKGYPTPKPASPVDLLAKKFSRAARQETKRDSKTGMPYRVNHAYLADSKNQVTLWIDIDEAPRNKMQKAAVQRREQVIGDLTQLTNDVDHWNRINPAENPIQIELDFEPDIEWRRHGGDAQEEAS